MTITIDGAGRVVIPKEIRNQLNLVTGSELEVEVTGFGICLTTTSSETKLVEKRGILIFDGTGVSDINIPDFINQQRMQRAGNGTK
jgi:AbrB family looped-hinge helix DNA binding protein